LRGGGGGGGTLIVEASTAAFVALSDLLRTDAVAVAATRLGPDVGNISPPLRRRLAEAM